MPELILTVFAVWLFIKALGLALKMTWGITKFFASLLFTIALPLLFTIALPLLGFCLFFAGGLLILVPLGLIALAFGLLKACV